MEAGLQVKNRSPVLDSHDTAGRETAAIADAINFVKDRCRRIAWAKKVGVERVDHAAGLINCARSSNQGLACDLAAEDPLTIFIG